MMQKNIQTSFGFKIKRLNFPFYRKNGHLFAKNSV